MPRLRVHRARVQSAYKLRVHRAGAAGAVDAAPRVRVHRAGATGTVVPQPRLRVHRGRMTGAAAPVVVPAGALTSEPEVMLTLRAGLVGGGDADSWVWRVVSGIAPDDGLASTGAACTFRVPSVMPPSVGSLVVGATATVAGVAAAEKTTTVTLLPQTTWSRVHGGNWVGATRSGV